MKNAVTLLAALAAVLVIVVWYFVFWTPSADELAVVEEEIELTQTQQDTTRSRIAALRGVREEAPQLEAELAAAESLLPRDPALPSALRQLQQAADDSGATLVSVAPSRPTPVEGADTELHAFQLNLELQGSYFQIVDVLRRLEDPAISPRGMEWSDLSLAVGEYPILTASLSGTTYAVLPAGTAEGGAPDAPPAEDDDPVVDGEDEGDASGDEGGTTPPDPATTGDGAEEIQ